MGRLTDLAKERFGAAVVAAHDTHGDETITVRAGDIVDVLRRLRDDADTAFNFMMDLTAVDYLGKRAAAERFEVVYHLYSLKHNHRLRVKAVLPEEDPSIESVTSVWRGADWFEREAWDLYGVVFKGHPNLKRILLYEEFEGHPLRKDYNIRRRQPLVGPEN